MSHILYSPKHLPSPPRFGPSRRRNFRPQHKCCTHAELSPETSHVFQELASAVFETCREQTWRAKGQQKQQTQLALLIKLGHTCEPNAASFLSCVLSGNQRGHYETPEKLFGGHLQLKSRASKAKHRFIVSGEKTTTENGQQRLGGLRFQENVPRILTQW